MTTAELYDVYTRAYADFDRLLGGAPGSPAAAGTPIERAIAEYAAEDAANGIGLRSREQFARAIADGAAALGPLGLRAA
ncbi:MAG: hypothetical protein IPO09_00785 [Anaeromyxobacter sp.]|nr:hypothetical protein [Anaeromyxobacter sp.]MBL0278296.1 hypothetical protein [Anaeromyxobacter sp.]